MIDYKIERNPIIYINDVIGIQTIGDPHLGREFKTNVPSEKKGIRESLVLNDFNYYLTPQNDKIKCIVIMGDLFDKFIVNPIHVSTAYDAIYTKASEFPDILYIIIPGNHDLSKDITKVSSFEIFYKLCELSFKKNLKCILNEDFLITEDDYSLLFTAYNPFNNSSISDLIINKIKNKKDVITFGHFDGYEINGKGYIPCEEILKYSSLIVSGHEHTFKVIENDEYDIKVLFTGSLQPYSHAEDPLNEYYITILDEDLNELDTTKFKNLNVRIICDREFIIDEKFECLSLSYKLKDIQEEILEFPSHIIYDDENSFIDEESLTFIEQLILDLEQNKDLEQKFKDLYLLKFSTRDYIK